MAETIFEFRRSVFGGRGSERERGFRVGRQSMARSRAGPSLKQLMLLIAMLLAVVVFYRMLSSMELDLVSKQSHNRVYYERLYSEVSDEVADWRQRYDNEILKAEERLQSLEKVETVVKNLQEENTQLKEEVKRLTEELTTKELLELQ